MNKHLEKYHKDHKDKQEQEFKQQDSNVQQEQGPIHTEIEKQLHIQKEKERILQLPLEERLMELIRKLNHRIKALENKVSEQEIEITKLKQN
jgi:hypothetical protein